jgi:hypothetical protein
LNEALATGLFFVLPKSYHHFFSQLKEMINLVIFSSGLKNNPNGTIIL